MKATHTVNWFSPLVFFNRLFSCWKCGRENMNSLQCSACQATLDHTNINYFELFGLKPSFDLDITKIVSKYHNLQILYHPDKHSSDNKEEKVRTAKFSTLANKAYSTLLNPLDRGIYILKLNNVSLELTSDENQLLLDNILELSDEISRAASQSHLKKLKETIQLELKELSSSASTAFQKQNYEEARKIIVKMKYYNNLMDQLKDKEMSVE